MLVNRDKGPLLSPDFKEVERTERLVDIRCYARSSCEDLMARNG